MVDLIQYLSIDHIDEDAAPDDIRLCLEIALADIDWATVREAEAPIFREPLSLNPNNY